MRKIIKPLLVALVPVIIALTSYSLFNKMAKKEAVSNISEIATNGQTVESDNQSRGVASNENYQLTNNSTKTKSKESFWGALFGNDKDSEADFDQTILNEPANGANEKNGVGTNAKKSALGSKFTVSKSAKPLTSSNLKNGASDKNLTNHAKAVTSGTAVAASGSSTDSSSTDVTGPLSLSLPNENESRRPDFSNDNKNSNPVNDITNALFGEPATAQTNSETATATVSSDTNNNIPFVGGNVSSENREPATTSSSSASSGSGSASSSSSATNSYQVGGTVTGLNGTVVIQNNGTDDLTITQNGKYVFSKYILDQKSFSVTVKTQPSVTTQLCTVTNGSGTISGDSVSNINIHCSNAFTVGGTLSGLTSGSLVLQNNSGNSLTLTANGSFTFTLPVEDLLTYAVTIATQPTGESCQLTNASGTISNSNITNVSVVCTASASATPTTYTVGGTITGLNGTVTLQNNSGDNISLFANGTFTFVTSLNSADTYAVTVLTQPANHPTTPHQTCSVTNGSGTIGAANITNVTINCVTNSYTVAGTVTGLSGILVLQNNGGDDKTIVANGAFTFATAVNDLSTYSVTVLTNPTSPHQTCALAQESGTISDANVTNVSVTCTTNTYTVGATVAGLNGTLVLQNNGGDNKTVTTNGAFTFTTGVADQAAYAITIHTMPTDQICAVTANDNGTVNGANVTNPTIHCATPTLTFTNIASSYLTVNWSSLTSPQSTAAGIEYKLYKNTGSIAVPTWTTVQNWTTSLSLTLSSGINPETIYQFKLDTRDASSNTVSTTASIQTPGVGYTAAILLESATGAVSSSDVAINSSNKSFAIWMQTETASGDETIMVSQNGGTNRTWTTPYRINSSHDFASTPIIAVDPTGNAIAVWSSNTATNFLYASRYDSTAATPSWSTPVNISNIEADAFYDAGVTNNRDYTKIAMDNNGNALVVWTQDVRIAGSWRTHIVSNYFDKSANSGAGAWLGHDVVDSSTNTAAPTFSERPRVSFDSAGNGVAIWTQHDANYHIFSAKFLIADKQWHAISQVDSEAGNIYATEMLLKTDNDIFAIWADPSGNNLKGGRYEFDNPGAWSVETIGTSNYLTNGDNYLTRIAANATGNTAVVYSNNTTLAVNKYNITTDTWGTPTEFSGSVATPGGFINSSVGFDGSSSIFDDSKVYIPQVTIDNSNNMLALWTERGHGSTAYAMKMFAVKYNGTSQAWEAPVLLEYAAKSGSEPYYTSKLVTNPSGKSLVVYKTVDNDLYVRHLDENLYATPYTLTYDNNGATSGSVPTDTTYYTTEAEALGNTGTLVKTGYAFTGWNTAADGSGTLYSATDAVSISGNTTLYATWAPPPTVITSSISNNVGGGTVSTAANCSITAAGIVWSTSANPTTADSKTTDGHAGVFTSTMTGLIANTTYYVRAYATNCAGNTYGNEVTYTTGNYVVRGTGPAGGLVFYDKGSVSDGWRYLEAAPSDFGATRTWSEVNPLTGNWDITIGTTATGIGTGKTNTASIISTLGNGTYAAKNIYDLTTAGYNDWFLPSRDELVALYTNLKAYGVGALTTNTYWSSSEQSQYNSYMLTFTSATPSTNGKNSTNYLRAIRAFSGDNSLFTITYDGNGNTGGTVPTDGSTYDQGQAVTMAANTGTLVKAGYSFNGWKTVASGTATIYEAAATFPMPNANTTMYANWVTAATVTTTNVDYTSSTLTMTTAIAGGNVTDDGGGVTARGVCWSTSQNPTIADSKTNNGQGSGAFSSYLTGLTAGTRYYIRAYATNGAGTSYGAEATFITAYNTNGVTGPAGGLVFYDKGSYSSSWRFLEAAPVASEHTNKEFGCAGTTIGTSNSSGTGKANTDAILANCSSTTNAASYCNDLVQGGFSDWYLPSGNDLNYMRTNLHVSALGNFTTGVYYASSSEYSASTANWAYLMNFTNAGLSNMSKATSTYVRCVRGFGDPTQYSVTYDGNGNTSGAAPTDATAYSQGQALTVANSGTLAKTGYTFIGWNTQADGNGTNYSENDIITFGSSNVTLYANWSLPYIVMFATQAVTADLKTEGAGSTGRIGADNLCSTAKTNSYPGLTCTRTRALINFSSPSTDTIIKMTTNYYIPTTLPIQSTTANTIADDWADLTDGSIDMTLDSAGVTSDVFWMGPSGFNCSNWTSTAGTNGRIGYPNQTNSNWWDGSDLSCANSYRILCVCW